MQVAVVRVAVVRVAVVRVAVVRVVVVRVVVAGVVVACVVVPGGPQKRGVRGGAGTVVSRLRLGGLPRLGQRPSLKSAGVPQVVGNGGMRRQVEIGRDQGALIVLEKISCPRYCLEMRERSTNIPMAVIPENHHVDSGPEE